MKDALKITVGLPPKLVSPNARAGFYMKSSAVRLQREEAFYQALSVLNELGLKKPRWRRIAVTAEFFKPGARAKRADADNCIASLKGVLDGLQDAGIVHNDQGVEWEKVSQHVGMSVKGKPRVEITVREITIREITEP